MVDLVIKKCSHFIRVARIKNEVNTVSIATSLDDKRLELAGKDSFKVINAICDKLRELDVHCFKVRDTFEGVNYGRVTLPSGSPYTWECTAPDYVFLMREEIDAVKIEEIEGK